MLWVILQILWMSGVYGSYIVDEFGFITLPLRTNFCQHTLPIDTYTRYECEEDHDDHAPIIHKTTYDESLCGDIYTEEDDHAHDDDHEEEDAGLDSDLDDVDTDEEDHAVIIDARSSSIDYNCTQDLTNPIELYDETHYIAIRVNCHLDPPAERRLVLAEEKCFLLSNVTESDSTYRALYGILGCNAHTHSFHTKLYLNDAKCGSDPVVTRTIPIGECQAWLFMNETEFPFNLNAAMWDCDEGRGHMRFKMNIVMMLSLITLQIFDV